MKKNFALMCVLTTLSGSLFAAQYNKMYVTRVPKEKGMHRPMMTRPRPMRLDRRGQHGMMRGHMRFKSAKRFVGKYLAMTPEQQQAVRDQIKSFVKQNAKSPDFLNRLKADLNALAGNPSEAPLTAFFDKVNSLKTQQEKVDFLKTKWRQLSREPRHRLAMRAARYLGFVDAVENAGLMSQFKDEIAKIKDRLMKLEGKGSVPADSEKTTDRLKDEEGIADLAVMSEGIETPEESVEEGVVEIDNPEEVL